MVSNGFFGSLFSVSLLNDMRFILKVDIVELREFY